MHIDKRFFLATRRCDPWFFLVRRIVCADTVYSCSEKSSATSFGALRHGLTSTFLQMPGSSLVVKYFYHPFCVIQATLLSFLDHRTMSPTVLDFIFNNSPIFLYFSSFKYSWRTSFLCSKNEFLPLRAIFV